MDGWLARRCGVASHFGARFDLEVDSLLILILAVLVWQSGRVGAWVLAIGLARYAFVLAGWLCRCCAPRCRRAAGARRYASSRVSLCCSACCRRSGAPAPSLGAGLALAGLLASFAADIIYLVRTRVRSAASGAVARDPDRAILVSTLEKA